MSSQPSELPHEEEVNGEQERDHDAERGLGGVAALLCLLRPGPRLLLLVRLLLLLLALQLLQQLLLLPVELVQPRLRVAHEPLRLGLLRLRLLRLLGRDPQLLLLGLELLVQLLQVLRRVRVRLPALLLLDLLLQVVYLLLQLRVLLLQLLELLLELRVALARGFHLALAASLCLAHVVEADE